MKFVLLFSIFISMVFAEPVVIRVYYESLCPDSQAFILKQLVPTYAKLSSIIDLRLVAFGNAKWTTVNQTGEQYDVSFTCQHGAAECLGNQIQSCASSFYPVADALALVNCMFASTNVKSPAVSGKECATKLDLDWNFLHECSLSPLGRGLVLLNGEATNSLNPVHNWIPWITVNGSHTNSIQTLAETNFLKLVCDNYTGTKPSACS